ncbi:ATP synthase protein I [Candidatus Enterovibrio altilux]|uniref:ATP synthase protein I n=2 Tax=Candidatus Enterovibrio altilux TaxID=1927128 RepID=A0A291B925_9GAMM|nr:ATP synthase protein I [Candidatus Enterovibrio luxaltus]
MVSFYSGEIFKIVLTIILFCVVYLYAEVELVPLKLAYLLILGVNIFAPILFTNNK